MVLRKKSPPRVFKATRIRIAMRKMNKNQRQEYINEMRVMNVDPLTLKRGGAGLAELKAAGVMAIELKKANLLSRAEVKSLLLMGKELRRQGVGFLEIIRASKDVYRLWRHGVLPAKLKQAGYGLEDLLKAEVKAKEAKELGYPIEDFIKAGFDGKSLLEIGFTKEEVNLATSKK